MKLDKKVAIGSGFRRSINIATDKQDEKLIKNYICPPSSEKVLHSMVQHIKDNSQCSFTWTGPYGSGKSSLALFMSSLLSKDEKIVSLSKQKLSIYKKDILNTFSNNKYSIITSIGKSKNPIEVLAEELDVKPNEEEIFKKLKSLSNKEKGLILIIDEMGKFLENATKNKDLNVYFFQQLAELCNRSNGKLIFIGILHQSFAEYSRKLSKTDRDEWIKIQGRFVDLAINAAGEEQINLIAKAIVCNEKPIETTEAVKIVVNEISRNKPLSKEIIEASLNQCWPLHPIVSSLLGPVSNKRFGQNQRSIFSFLCSAEPFGFQEFIRTEDYKKDTYYAPHMFWEYIKFNLGNSILASSEAKQWTVAIEAINKASVNYKNDFTCEILKTIALINIFRGASGLNATEEVLLTAFDKKVLLPALEELKSLSLIRYNKHYKNYYLYEGSDFDIESEIEDALTKITDIDFIKLNDIAHFQPVIAKRHYHEKGAMRWMDIQILPLFALKNISKEGNSFGKFIIIVPENKDEYDEAKKILSNNNFLDKNYPIILSVSDDYEEICGFSNELLALEWLKKNSPKLGGDKIARKEVENKHTMILTFLNRILEKSMNSQEWFFKNKSIGFMCNRKLSSFCSDLADNTFNKSPVIKSEMLNRNKPSNNANASLNKLLKRMVLNQGEKRLGIEGFPAEGGIFNILLEDTGIYQNSENLWQYKIPCDDTSNIKSLWDYTDKILQNQNSNYSIKNLYNEWEKAPFGIKKGLQSFLLLSYLLLKKEQVAVYLDGTYVPEINDLFVDYLIKNTSDICLRYVSEDKNKKAVLGAIVNTLKNSSNLKVSITPNSSPLEVSRELVSFVLDKINPWTLRTKNLSKDTLKLREVLKNAHDPNKLIFDDIPKIFDLSQAENKSKFGLKDALSELQNAYPNLIKKIGTLIIKELQVNPLLDKNYKKLNDRASNVRGRSGDFRIDALATRLANFSCTVEDIEGIAGLAANKPTHEWIDLDVDRACIEITVLCEGFRKAELYTKIKGKEPKRHAIGLISSLSGTKETRDLSFDILEDNKPIVNDIKLKISSAIPHGSNPEVILAAITELSFEYIDKINSKAKLTEVC